jgi:hypothetical protein
VSIIPVKSNGRNIASGYLDSKNTPKALPGDKRIYARNSSGDVVVELWLKNEGSAILTNNSGTLTLESDGKFNINGVIIDTSGNITTSSGTITAQKIIGTSSVEAASKELAGHTHPAGDPPGNTGPNN